MSAAPSRDMRAACLCAATVLAVLLWASASFPLVWDEAIYFKFSDSLRQWASSGFPMDAAALRQYWDYSPYHNPHPPLFKIFSAVTAAWGGFLAFPLAYRLPHLLFGAAVCAALFAALRRRFGAGAAAAALACALLQPRVFGELLVATTDGPTLLAWLASSVLLWCREKEESFRARRALAWAFAAIFTAACAVKVTALLVVLPLAGWSAARRKKDDLILIAASAAAGVALAAWCSPAAWSSPFQAVAGYLYYPFTRAGTPISTFYAGQVYDGLKMPWHTFSVMTLATLPPLLLVAVPAAAWSRGPARELCRALLPALLFWVLLVHVPGVPRHDGVRQFVSVYPLLGLLAWAGWRAAVDRLAAPRVPPRAAQALGALPPVYLAVLLAAAHPFEMSYYSGAVGGLRGAESRGFEMSYALEPVGAGVTEWLNNHALPGAHVGIFPPWPPLLTRYQKAGRLRPDFVFTPRSSGLAWDYIVVCRRRSEIQDAPYRAAQADFEVSARGVSLAKVFAPSNLPVEEKKAP